MKAPVEPLIKRIERRWRSLADWLWKNEKGFIGRFESAILSFL